MVQIKLFIAFALAAAAIAPVVARPVVHSKPEIVAREYAEFDDIFERDFEDVEFDLRELTGIARETVRPVRKDVVTKSYGGDISRKVKLLEKQRRVKRIGEAEIPQTADEK